MQACVRLAASLLAGMLSLSAHALAIVPIFNFTFDSNAQGWTVFDGGNMTWQGAGGNGGGHLQISDLNDGDFQLDAPSTALGNLSFYFGGSLSFDARNIDGATPDWAGFGQITITGANGTGTLIVDTIPLGQPGIGAGWQRYSVPLTTAIWGASLPTVLANVAKLSIEAEFHAGQPELVGVDNISITAVPEPADWVLMLAGLGVVAAFTRHRARA